MCNRYRASGDNAALVTVHLQYYWHSVKITVIVMHVAGMLIGKIKRRRTTKESTDADGEQLTVESGTRRKSSRITALRRRQSDLEKMNLVDGTQDDVATKLNRRLQSARDSNDYKVRRQALLENERQAAWDRYAREAATPTEVEANSILWKIREHERDTLFGNVAGEDIPGPETLDLGGRFLVSKARIEESRVFKAARQMPKGAHLHLHFNSEIPPEKLMPLAREKKMEDTIFIASTRPLRTLKDFDEAEIVFEVWPRTAKRGNIFAQDYIPLSKVTKKDPSSGAFMRWVDFRTEWYQQPHADNVKIENQLGGTEWLDGPVEHWAREKMIITLERAYHDRQTTNGAWACFNIGTRAFKGLLGYESAYRWYVRNAVESMIRDKVMYAELRPMLLDKYIPSDDGERRLDHKAQMTIICEEVESKQKQLREDGKLDQFPFGVKIIYSTPRSITLRMMEKELQDCISLKLQFPALVCGFDLVGAEDRKNNIGFYDDLLIAFTQTCRELGIEIPFMFHAGETLLDTGGSHDPNKSNLYDALLLNAKRIGHGYALLKHPILAQKYKDNNICLELCPISNELLHLCGNARQHIFPELLAAGLHCTLNADNPSLFRGPTLDSSSLSHEFYQVMAGDPRMSIHGWKQLAWWSIDHSCLDTAQQKEARRIFNQEWEDFCEWVVGTYAEYASKLPELE